MSDAPTMTPEDTPRIVVVEELDLSADGRTATVVRRSIRGNRYVGHLFAIDLASDRAIPPARQLTRGVVRDTKPRLCPDGHTLAFVRTDPTDDDPSQPSRCSTFAGRIASGWRGSSARRGRGDRLVAGWSSAGVHGRGRSAPVHRAAGRDPSPAVGRPRALTPRRRWRANITRADWRWDEEGHRDRWSHLFVLDTAARPAAPDHQRRLGCRRHRVAPRRAHRRVPSDRGPQPDLRPRTTIWAVDVDVADAEPREVLAPGGWATHPRGRRTVAGSPRREWSMLTRSTTWRRV
jgi:hypothetical protein